MWDLTVPLELIINRIENENAGIRVLYLTAADGSDLPAYTPGAHIDVALDGIGTRSYSLIDFSPPMDPPFCYCIAVQREDAGQGGSVAMHQYQFGDIITATEPCNDFELRQTCESPVILVAGGIGVTPLISMATKLQESAVEFQFHYSGRNAAVTAFRKVLEEQFGEQLFLYLDDENPVLLDAVFSSSEKPADVYICGPAGMIEATREAALAAGVSADAIHVELFSTPVTASADEAFEVEIQSTGQVYTIPVGKSIIDVLEDEGLDLVFDCQRGDCGICQTDVISGTPDHRDVVLSEAEKASGKVMQICVSRARSERLVLDL
ncbi:ferredoxin [Chromatiales bacterium (ex Bugula neritina AB1)]|nr:ferredoxin [Chromatiales bacterium (ex Bugula neritina AB1)]